MAASRLSRGEAAESKSIKLRSEINLGYIESEADYMRSKVTTQENILDVNATIEKENRLILGINHDENLSVEDIHRAFHKKIKEVHPDLSRGYASGDPSGAVQKVVDPMNILTKMKPK